MKRRLALALGLALIAGAANAAPRNPVSVALVLAVDVSGSVDQGRYALQREGIAAAFERDNGGRLIDGGLAVAVMEWSGVDQQKVTLPWIILRTRQDEAAFAALVRSMPRAFDAMTAVGDAIVAATALVAECPCDPVRRVIDVSGDGSTNAGSDAATARDLAAASGITVNGLPIVADEPNVDQWYRANVIGGEGAFLVVAQGFEAVAEAMEHKLILEVSGDRPRLLPIADEETETPRCAPFTAIRDALEKQYGELPVAVGQNNDGRTATMVLATKDGATFTILFLEKSGLACPFAAGEHWQAAR